MSVAHFMKTASHFLVTNLETRKQVNKNLTTPAEFNHPPHTDSCDVIEAYATTNMKVQFPLMDKIEVNGPNTHPIYKYLKQQLPGDLKWNFEKFLIDANGIPVRRFDTQVSPLSIEQDLTELFHQ